MADPLPPAAGPEVVDAELVTDAQYAAATRSEGALAVPGRVREPQVRQVGRIRADITGAHADFLFSDRNRRAPERRRLAILLTGAYGLSGVGRARWRTVTEDTGMELTASGHLRGTSETSERLEWRDGHRRDDLEVRGDSAEQVARFAEELPDVLDRLDELSAAWAAMYRRELATHRDSEYWMTPQEHDAAVRRWRRDFAEAVAHTLADAADGVALAAGAEEAVATLHQHADAAALAALRVVGLRPLAWPRPERHRASVSGRRRPALPRGSAPRTG
ncbi:hypothetical protein [Kitasatospora sp. NPDC088783]|uniref:hypothetical protein n=1 Tax=Kitasatospora sp. NPDC088783 TaxID=3364077 RepID=UPI00382E7D49